MLVLSLRSVIESRLAHRGSKAASGQIRSFESLLTPENLAMLESQSQGVFAFLAFHPVEDAAVTEYIRLGALGDDATDHVLALFALDHDARAPQIVDEDTFAGLVMSAGETPIHHFVRTLFEPALVPTLPGIVFLETLVRESEPVFVGLPKDGDKTEIGRRCRKIFELASHSYLKTASRGNEFSNHLCKQLALNNIPYNRTQRASTVEWFIAAYHFIAARGYDLVSAVSEGFFRAVTKAEDH